jgi:uncharacterized membrane protein YeiH
MRGSFIFGTAIGSAFGMAMGLHPAIAVLTGMFGATIGIMLSEVLR